MPASSAWLTAPEAVAKYGIAYNALRDLVRKGVLTRGVFGAAEERPPIYVREAELEAWKTGGITAVGPVKAAYEASIASPQPATTKRRQGA